METGRGKYIHLNITWKNRGPEHDTTVRNQCIRTENTAREHTFRSVVKGYEWYSREYPTSLKYPTSGNAGLRSARHSALNGG